LCTSTISLYSTVRQWANKPDSHSQRNCPIPLICEMVSAEFHFRIYRLIHLFAHLISHWWAIRNLHFDSVDGGIISVWRRQRAAHKCNRTTKVRQRPWWRHFEVCSSQLHSRCKVCLSYREWHIFKSDFMWLEI